MPVTMGGMASGLDTDGIIKKLVEVEARPIRQWEEDLNNYNRRKEALNTYKVYLNNLNNAVKEIYGFRSSYNDKKAVSSDPAVFTANANRYAENGNRKIEVIDLASTHKIASDPVKEGVSIPSGRLTLEVNGESATIKFKGGTLQSFQDRINEEASRIVTTSYITMDEATGILTIESKVPGKKGEIKITGDMEFLKGIGLVKGEKEREKDRISVTFDNKFFTAYTGEKKIREQSGSLEVDKEGKSISVRGTLWKEYSLPLEVSVSKDTVLEFDFGYNPPRTEDEEILPLRLEIGPDDRIVIKGIELKSYNIPRVRPEEKKDKKEGPPDITGIGVVSREKDRRIEKLYRIDPKAKGKQSIPLGTDLDGKTVSKIIFYCDEGEARYAEPRIETPKPGKGLLEPKNEITKSSDARLKVDGIEITRDRNDNLNDVIKGITLNLLGKSKSPVSLKTEPDIDKSIDKIKKFIEAYNKYLDYTKELTKVEKSEKPGEYMKNRAKSGPFIGDMTILRLANALKTAISDAYPGRSEKPIRIISQMGISTGALNAEWESIRDGKLVIDQEKLVSTIRDNPDGMEEFFGSDSDGDKKIDSGMGFRIEYILKPYVTSGKNIIVTKISLEENAIASTNQKIDRHHEHLKKYEDRLRRKFSAMEKSISGANSQKRWMEGQFKNLPGENKKD